MKKLMTTIVLLLVIALGANAKGKWGEGTGFYLRDSTWKVGGFAAFNVNQVALYQWSQGGTPSFSFLVSANGYAKYKKKKVIWDNNVDVKWGMVATGLIRNAALARQNLQKNIDLLQFSTNVGYEITKSLYASFKLDFLSQFSKSYDYSQTNSITNQRFVTSKFAAPAYLTIGPGLTWKPKDYVTVFISPIEGKMTFVRDGGKTNFATKDSLTGAYPTQYYDRIDETKFGLTKGSGFQAQLGGEIDVLFQKDIVKNVNWKSHLKVFVAYVTSSYNTTMQNDSLITAKSIANLDSSYYLSMSPKMISKSNQYIPNVLWENDITMKINKFLSVLLSVKMQYQYNSLLPVDKLNNKTFTKTADGLTDVNNLGKNVLTYNGLQIFEQFGVGLSYKF